MDYLIYFLIDSLVSAGIMFLACKITGVVIQFKWLLISVAAAALVSLIPSFGWVLSLIVLFWFLNQYSNAKLWPDLVFMVLVSRIITVFLVIPFLGG